MRLTLQKRLAAQLLKCSQKKIQIDETRLEEAKEAITKRDVRGLIQDKAIVKKDTNEQSKVRARKKQAQKRKGKQKGAGKRKGTANARSNKKDEWKAKVRLQRELIKSLKVKEKMDNKTYRTLYNKIGGGFFRSRRHLKLYITERELAKK